MFTGQQVVDRAWIKANDLGVTKRWPSSEALLWVNDSQRLIVEVLPSACVKKAVVTLAGGTRQTAAGLGLSDVIQFVDATRNLGSEDVPAGVMTKTEKAYLDDMRPDWHTETGTRVWHWMGSDIEPDVLWVWPAVSGGRVEVVYHARPAELGALSSPLSLPDHFMNIVQCLVLEAFFSKDITEVKSAQLAGMYWQKAAQMLIQQGANRSLIEQKSTDKARQ